MLARAVFSRRGQVRGRVVSGLAGVFSGDPGKFTSVRYRSARPAAAQYCAMRPGGANSQLPGGRKRAYSRDHAQARRQVPGPGMRAPLGRPVPGLPAPVRSSVLVRSAGPLVPVSGPLAPCLARAWPRAWPVPGPCLARRRVRGLRAPRVTIVVQEHWFLYRVADHGGRTRTPRVLRRPAGQHVPVPAGTRAGRPGGMRAGIPAGPGFLAGAREEPALAPDFPRTRAPCPRRPAARPVQGARNQPVRAGRSAWEQPRARPAVPAPEGSTPDASTWP